MRGKRARELRKQVAQMAERNREVREPIPLNHRDSSGNIRHCVLASYERHYYKRLKRGE